MSPPKLPKICIGSSYIMDAGGGIPKVARLSAKALARHGRTPPVVSYLDRGGPYPLTGPVTPCYGSKLLFAVQMRRFARGADYVLYDNLGVARAHPRWGLPVPPYAVWIHGIEVWEEMPAHYRAPLERAHFVLVNSQYTLDRHQQLHGRLDNVNLCWLATESDEPPAKLADFAGPPTALILSRIDASQGRKGHNELIAAWPKILSAVPSARLVIAGAGTGLADLRAAVAASPAAASIDVRGFVETADLPALFCSAHVFAMPSRQDGFGVVYAEAMRFGLPCIASRQDAGQEVNADGVSGYNVDLERPQELGERLIALLSDADLAARLGAAAHRRWSEHFRYSRFAERFLKHWARFTGQPAAGSAADAPLHPKIVRDQA